MGARIRKIRSEIPNRRCGATWHECRTMKALVFLLSLACAGLGGLSLWQWLEHSRMQEELAKLKEENASISKMARAKASKLGSVDIKSKGPTGLEGIVPLEDEGLKDPSRTKPEKPGAKPGVKLSDIKDGLADMMKNKDAQELIKAQTGAQLELQYRDLFDDMKLDPAKRDAVLAILKNRTSAQMEDSFVLMDKSATPEAKKAATDRLTAATAEAQAKLKEALGEEAYQTFDRYEKSQPEREHLKLLNSMLKDKNLALDEAAESKLMDAMYNERVNFKYDADLSNPRTVSPDALSDESVDRFVEQNTTYQQQVQAKVKDILTPEQFEVFVQSQKSQTEALRMGLQLLRGTDGGADGKD